MITREQRRKLEPEWTAEERSILQAGRLVKAGVLAFFILGLALIGVGTERPYDAQATAAAAAVPAGHQLRGGSAVQESRRVFESRRAQWEGKSGPGRQVTAER